MLAVRYLKPRKNQMAELGVCHNRLLHLMILEAYVTSFKCWPFPLRQLYPVAGRRGCISPAQTLSQPTCPEQAEVKSAAGVLPGKHAVRHPSWSKGVLNAV